ncbi:tRNA(Ile)-lysidine synthase [mine drainage metagenome]|uniref:tRNA(Ile)-lysidine synthetase n=1 Tax=mine drainage metagenome TaxID=410659 RepID=A0A1J5RZK1_9ZZZZ
MDSVVLLHLLHTLAPRFEWQLSALHVHHGLSPNADSWADFCSGLCIRLNIPLHIERVDISPLQADHGIEAAARKLRHAAFARQKCDFIALAHHADDQAETLLLQLLRGAGIRGVAAMPVLSKVEGPVLSKVEGPLFKPAPAPATLRPLLDIPRGALAEYAQQHRLDWVEDESNADEDYPRNFLRHRLLPLLEQRFPAYRDTLARSARHFAEAGELLDELALQDMQDSGDAAALDVARLRALPHARAKNLLRFFLHKQLAPMPHAAQLDDMLRQLCDAREDAAVCVEFGHWQVRRYRDKAYVTGIPGQFDPGLVLPWRGEAELRWPALDRGIAFSHVQGAGISLGKLQREPVTLRLRSGSESLRPSATAATRSLKNLFQERHVPPWQRERLPLLYCGDELVCVVGVAIHADFQAEPGESGVLVSWD